MSKVNSVLPSKHCIKPQFHVYGQIISACFTLCLWSRNAHSLSIYLVLYFFACYKKDKVQDIEQAKLDKLIDNMKLSILLYADDILLVAMKKSAEYRP